MEPSIADPGDSDHSPTPEPVLAFGGVVWRTEPDGGDLQVAVVHRPRYDDWSFPKGKVDPGETPQQTALREVDEETGLRCRLGPALGSVRYPLPDGQMKIVGYWAMEVVDRRHRTPDDEVDTVSWWPATTAAGRLSHSQDVDILQRFLDTHPITPGSEPDRPR